MAPTPEQEIEIGAGVCLHDVMSRTTVDSLQRRLGGCGAFHPVLRRASSSSDTSIRSTRQSTSSSIMSPSRTRASGPPTAASGQRAGRPSVGGAAHAGIRDAHHVGDARLRSFGGRPMLPTSAMPGIALGAAVLEHQHAVLVDIEIRIVDARVVMLDALEDHGAPAMPHEARGRRGRLHHRTVGREIAAQHRDAALRGRRVDRTAG